MATNDVVTRLAKVPVFSGCSKKELAAIARTVREIDHPAGTVIATEGEPGAGLFVIERGEADVTIGGKRVNLWPGKPGAPTSIWRDKSWQVVEIPLDQLDPSVALASITFSGKLTGTFYLDDIRLVAARPS